MNSNNQGRPGQELGFESFYASNYPDVYRLLLVMTRSASDADDLSQEAMVRVYERWRRVQSMESPRGYLIAIALNLARRSMRMRGILAPLSAVGERPSVDGWNDVSDVFIVLEKLPRRLREAIVLMGLLEMTSEEAGRVLRIRPGAARVRLARARERLRDEIGARNASR